jgi:hypothetical protein
MNILDKISGILRIPNIALGSMPDAPDNLIALFEYSGKPPDQSFGGTDFNESVQVRSRADTAGTAYSQAETVANKLNRYHDSEVSILQSTPILDIGHDSANPQRQEYTVNFLIRRY